ncbi:MAG: cobalamin biosynthesis protein CbiD [Peptococcaceae bacterium]|nr:cobalamin biosynthesis protein CbiD [Peptococcaceae bacterium]
MQKHLKYKNNLRSGYTTGSCAAAAAKASTWMLLGGQERSAVTISTPGGSQLTLSILDIRIVEGQVSCAVKKDGGDDPDITNGLFIYASVSKIPQKSITISGGEGIGRVTKPGLACKVGEAAINPVPREMIINEVKKVCSQFHYTGGLSIVISVPGGEAVAGKTFNPRLGIIGGISILGTTGIVEPMSEKAWIDSIYLEMKQQTVLGNKNLLVCPGNYGETFIKNSLKIHADRIVKCSNFIGEVVDFAQELELDSLLLIGHAGKLVKLGFGIMNTHSRIADSRMEVLAFHAALCGASVEQLRGIMDCNTTEEAASFLRAAGICQEVFDSVMNKIDFYIQKRVHKKVKTAVVLFSNELGVLGKTGYADELIKLHQG